VRKMILRVDINDDCLRIIRKICEYEGTNISSVINRAVRYYLSEYLSIVEGFKMGGYENGRRTEKKA